MTHSYAIYRTGISIDSPYFIGRVGKSGVCLCDEVGGPYFSLSEATQAIKALSEMTLADYLALDRPDARAHDAAIIATLTHWPRLVPEWECDGEPCYACFSEKTGEHYTGTSSRAAFARMLEAEEVYLRHNLPQHPDILFTEVER